MKWLMITLMVVLLTLVLSIPAMGSIQDNWDNWSSTDETRQSTFIAITVFDLYQTNVAMQYGAIECSPFVTPFVGSNPSQEELCKLVVTWIALNYLISRSLPPKARQLFQTICSSITFYEVSYSYGTRLVLNL